MTVPYLSKTWQQEIDNCRKSVEILNKLNPRFVVVCGDLTHTFPACLTPNADNLQEQQKMYEAQVRDFKSIMSQINPAIELVCVCGNHDVGNSPTMESIKGYRERFGDDYFAFWIHGVRCIVLNASLYSDPSLALDYHNEQEKWLANELGQFSQTERKPNHVFVFQHQPWFLTHHDEKDQYFNINIKTRLRVLEQFRQAGVRAVFAGHLHENSYGRFGDMEMITTSAVGRPLGTDASGFRLVKVYENHISHQYYSLDSVPSQVTL